MGEFIQRNSAAEIIAHSVLCLFLTAFLVFIVSSSFASATFVAFCLLIGLLLCFSCSKDSFFRQNSKVFLVVFVCYVILAIIQYLDITNSIAVFADTDNDHYLFWLESQEGAKSSSFLQVFNRCIINNEYVENGGYYFYIQTLAYYAQHLFDGNSLMLQLLGTFFPGMLSAIVFYQLLNNYVDSQSARKYALLYVLLTPALSVCFGIHRDAWIAFFYLCLIYLWLVKGFSVKTLILQLVITIILLSLRIQNGLFSVVFIFLTLISSKKKYRWLFYSILGVVLIAYGAVFYTIVNDEMLNTMVYYEQLAEESLNNVDDGLGRLVYQLPSPIKEVAQVIVLQMQFPPWLSIVQSNTFYGQIIGFLQLLINVFWLYIFTFTVFMFIKKKFLRTVSSDWAWFFLLFFVFIFLNSANLVLRRVVCIYPCLFLLFVYLKTTSVSKSENSMFSPFYILGYSLLCVTYLVAKSFL